MATKKKSRRADLESTRKLTHRNLFDVHHGDARLLAAALPDSVVDVTITSPPYFNIKDYGVPNQIGFGQDYESYLHDLQEVFRHLFRATKSNGSLWIVIDTFRRDQELLPLPFDLVAKLKLVGWVLRDVIIWKKVRTVPWVHQGKTKRIFEYILVLSKSRGPFRYFTDTQRDITDLKPWWIRYPERYNPRGKSLEEVWSYDIPIQGSWGKHYIRHFCPLPAELVARIIDLTTEKGDVVLDPFSGSGTVPIQTQLADRKYIGFEINKKYIAMFRRYARNLHVGTVNRIPTTKALSASQFETLIVNLRMLKFGRLLFRFAEKHAGSRVEHVLVRPLNTKPSLPHQICAAEYTVIIRDAALIQNLERHLDKVCAVRPLSKFGVSATLKFATGARAIASEYRKRRVFLYSSTDSHKFAAHTTISDALKSNYPIISVIRANVEVPHG